MTGQVLGNRLCEPIFSVDAQRHDVLYDSFSKVSFRRSDEEARSSDFWVQNSFAKGVGVDGVRGFWVLGWDRKWLV